MNENTYTRADYEKALKWAAFVEDFGSDIVGSQEAVRILCSLPEPAQTTFADIHTDEWAKHWGCAVENREHGWRGWALGTSSDGAIVVLIEENGLPTLWWWPENTVLLLDEPRLTIPGVTTEVKPTLLVDEEDYANAPTGTVVSSNITPYALWMKSEANRWIGFGGADTINDYEMAASSATVIRWGIGNE